MVGRTLRAEKLIDPSVRNERLWLQGEQTRVVTLEPEFVAETINDFRGGRCGLRLDRLATARVLLWPAL